MAKKKSLVFETEKRRSNGSLYRFWIILIISVLTVLSVSLALILKSNDFDFRKAFFGTEKEETTQETETQTVPTVSEAERIFLFMCADGDRQKIHFMNLIKVELPECRVTVLTLDPEAVIRATSGSGESSAAIFAKSGEKELTSALEEAYDIKINRYLSATPTQFKSTVNFFGGIKITVPEQVDYKADGINLVLIKGTKALNGDELYKYMLYLNDTAENGAEKQAKAIIEILGAVFTPKNVEKSDKIFSQITNNFTTDITVVDLREEEDGVLQLMQEGIKDSAVAVYPEELN
ncbi:MAG: LCP family protein [Clostridia bacterium]|nr:LCP family protein [Clostridia bacterium]